MWQKLGHISLPEGHRIKVGMVSFGTMNPNESAIAVATSAEQIIIVNYPLHHNKDDIQRNVLNANLPITTIHCSRIGNMDNDVLFFATRNHLHAFNVYSNSDVFTSPIPDGGNVVITSRIGDEQEMITLVGGNCCVQGFDEEGVEKMWLVTGDNVRSLALVEDELLVGSDDYDIRIFRGGDLVHEISETHIVTHLHALEDGLFAYTLGNGTVGVYEKRQRLWRVKSKHRATCLSHAVWQPSTLQTTSQFERVSVLVAGWHGGKVDIRSIRTGEVLIKSHMDDTVAGIVMLPQHQLLIAVSITGQLQGLNLKSSHRPDTKAKAQETIRELLTKKQDLMLELANYTKSTIYDAPIELKGIPARTRLQTCLAVVKAESENEKSRVEIILSTNNDTTIRAALIFAEGMFKGETQVKHPPLNDVDTTLRVALYPPTDVPIDIHIKALIGYQGNDQYHVFEVTRQLPRFSMYAYMDQSSSKVDATGSVQFRIKDRVQRVLLWMDKHFLFDPPTENKLSTNNELDIVIIGLRDGGKIGFMMDSKGMTTIRTDSMIIAGDFIQSLGEYLNFTELQSQANFPLDENACKELLDTMQQLDEAKRKLAMELGDRGTLVRSLIVRAEDARLLSDYTLQRKLLQELRLVARDLKQRHEIRAAQYADSVHVARQLKLIVQHGMRLRIVPSGATTPNGIDPLRITRNALTDYDPKPIINLIRTGHG